MKKVKQSLRFMKESKYAYFYAYKNYGIIVAKFFDYAKAVRRDEDFGIITARYDRMGNLQQIHLKNDDILLSITGKSGRIIKTHQRIFKSLPSYKSLSG